MKPIFIEVFDRRRHGLEEVLRIFERERSADREIIYISIRVIFDDEA